MTRTAFISDLHLSTEASFEGEHPYADMNPARIIRLVQFLNYVRKEKLADELVLLGDILDCWLAPHDILPPTAYEVLTAPPNRPAILALEAVIKDGIQVTVVPGNHDISAKSGVYWTSSVSDVCAAMRLIGCVSQDSWSLFQPKTHMAIVAAHHGHEHALFNGPDPKKRPPLGQWITRLATTLTKRTGQCFPSPGSMLMSTPNALMKLAKRGIPSSVWQAVVAAAGVLPADVIRMPWPVSNTEEPADSGALVKTVGESYASLYADRNSTLEDVLAEFDPFHSSFIGPEVVSIMGHSHAHAFSILDEGQLCYINVGAWCTDNETCYAIVQTDDNVCGAGLYRWTDHSEIINSYSFAL
jgi:hypothetical protein